MARDIYQGVHDQGAWPRSAAVALSFNAQRLGAIFIGVADHSLVGKAVDLDYRVLAEDLCRSTQGLRQ